MARAAKRPYRSVEGLTRLRADVMAQALTPDMPNVEGQSAAEWRHALSGDVRRIMEFVHAHLCEEHLCVKGIKASCNLHDNNISTRFRMQIGLTIREYIDRARLSLAARLLEDESISAWDVSYVVGYSHVQTFYRGFHREFGCTPGDYRKRISASPPGDESGHAIHAERDRLV
jgi:AraC-like DNA-binding protein